MTYEKPEALEIGAIEEVVLGTPKCGGPNDEQQLPQMDCPQIAEVASNY